MSDINTLMTNFCGLGVNFTVPNFPEIPDAGQLIFMWPGVFFHQGNNDILQPLVNYGAPDNGDPTCPAGQPGECCQINAFYFNGGGNGLVYVTDAYLASPGDSTFNSWGDQRPASSGC